MSHGTGYLRQATPHTCLSECYSRPAPPPEMLGDERHTINHQPLTERLPMKTTHNNATADLLADNHPAPLASKWDRWADKAATMTNYELTCAIMDCVETSRIYEASNMCGGKYRDEASVLRAEQARR